MARQLVSVACVWMIVGVLRGCREGESCCGRATVRAPIAEDWVSGKISVESYLARLAR